jgi:hypothetical protein
VGAVGDDVSDHKFKVGQTVHYTPGHFGSARPGDEPPTTPIEKGPSPGGAGLVTLLDAGTVTTRTRPAGDVRAIFFGAYCFQPTCPVATIRRLDWKLAGARLLSEGGSGAADEENDASATFLLGSTSLRD